MASPEFQALLQFLRDNPEPEEIDVAGQRKEEETAAAQTVLPADAHTERTTADTVPGLLVAATNARQERAILYFHGGGYVFGSSNTHRDLGYRISAAAAASVFLIDYRRAPEHPFPAAVTDAKTAYRWLLAKGVQPHRLVIAGDSAGGGLAVAGLLALRDEGEPLPAAVVCLSPWTDLALTADSIRSKTAVDPVVSLSRLTSYARMYLGDTDPHRPLASPLYADLTGLPPLLIQVGTAEILLDDAVRLAQRARKAGVEVTLDVWQEMIHGWQGYAGVLPEGQAAVDRIGEFVRQHTR